MNCEICGFECNNKAFHSHLKHKHNKSSKEYYDMYLKKPDEGYCTVCGRPTTLIGFNGYREHCSIACSTKDPQVLKKSKETLYKHYGDEGLSHPNIRQKKEKTCLEKYGVSSPSRSEAIQEKAKQTNLIKYSTEYTFQSEEVKEKIKRTNLERYGVEYISQSEQHRKKTSKSMLESGNKKQRETSVKKYGVEYAIQLDIVKEKRKETWIKNLGVDNPSKSKKIRDKVKNTLLQKYGVENILSLDWIGQSRNSNSAKQKRVNTNLIRWGVDNPIKSKQVQNKRLNTLRRNKTFNTSSLESYFLSRIKELNTDIYMQGELQDNRYPFAYDFYIPDKDLFIEINGNWTHGEHWFNTDNLEDNEKLSIWKEKSKNSRFYKNAIETWTMRDVNKRKTAQENDLNYVVLWNKKDIDLWFSLNCPIGKDWKKEYSWVERGDLL